MNPNPLSMSENEVQPLLQTERWLCQRLKDNYAVLKEKYQALMEDFSRLKNRFDSLDKSKREIETAHEAQVKRLTQDLEEKVKFLEDEQRLSANKFDQFKRSLTRDVSGKYDEIIQEMDEELTQSRADLNKSLLECAAHKSELNIVREKFELLQKTSAGSKAAMEKHFQAEKAAMQKRIEELLAQNRQTNTQGEISRLNATNKENRTEIEMLQKRVKSLSSELDLERDNSGRLTRDRDRSKEEQSLNSAASESKLTLMSGKLSVKDTEIADLRRKLADSERKALDVELASDKRQIEQAVAFEERIARLQANGRLLEGGLQAELSKNKELNECLERSKLASPQSRIRGGDVNNSNSTNEKHATLKTKLEGLTSKLEACELEKHKRLLATMRREQEFELRIRELEWEKERLSKEIVQQRSAAVKAAKEADFAKDKTVSTLWIENKTLRKQLDACSLDLEACQVELSRTKDFYQKQLVDAEKLSNKQAQKTTEISKQTKQRKSERTQKQRKERSADDRLQSEFRRLRSELQDARSREAQYADMVRYTADDFAAEIEQHLSSTQPSSKAHTDRPPQQAEPTMLGPSSGYRRPSPEELRLELPPSSGDERPQKLIRRNFDCERS